MFKSKVLFLSEKRDICPDQVALPRLWPSFSTQKNAANIWKTKFEDIKPNVWKSKMRGSLIADFLCGGASYRSEKKTQNSDFDWGPLHGEIGLLKKQIFFSKYLRNNSLVKYLKLSQTFNSTLLLLSSNWELCISSPKMYQEYLDTRRSVEIPIWNIWRHIKWETKSRKL